MTNEVSYAPIKYVCNGLSVDFAFPWKIFQAEDLIVTIQGQEGVLTLELEKDFTVEFDDVGGNVKTNKAWPDGTILVVARNTDDYQSKDFTTSTGFQASEIEKAFDRVSCNLQEMDYNIENFKETFSEQVGEEIDVLENVIEENKQEVLLIQERFEDEVNVKIEQVTEAAGKINALEQAVADAQGSAELAEQKANEANESLENLTTQGEQLIADVAKEIDRVEDAINDIDKNIDKIVNHVSFNLFDTKTTDHILTGKEAKGWALQGTYVTKESYPDFYNKCLEEYQNSNEAIIGVEPWTQPIATANTTSVDGGNMVISASSEYSGENAWKAMDGNNTSTHFAFNFKNSGWWQVKFPYKLLIKGLTYYSRAKASTYPVETATFYTSSDMTQQIGDTFSAPTADYTAFEVQNIPQEGIVTDTIYLTMNDSSSTCGMGELVINAQKLTSENYYSIYKNNNGHKFYPIEQKSAFDAIYNQYGIADFYGIDEENERVFLPRNKYFHQLTDDVSKVNEMIEAGLPNIEGTVVGGGNGGVAASQTTGAFKYVGNAPSKTQGASGGYESVSEVSDFDASRSNPIYGNSGTVQPPSSLKLLYYCVGNTEATQAITNVTEITTSENDTIPLFTGMYFDFKPNNVSWLKAGVQQNSAGIYKACYETLVEIVNGVNNYDLKVINQDDMVSGVIYDEYWILDQDNLTFRTPLTITTKSLTGRVMGDGMTLGLTDGINKGGLCENSSNVLICHQGNYGKDAGSSTTGNSMLDVTLGITTDPSKSGIVAEQSTAQLYFKVANAVQNLELLDAGEVLEGLANKLDRANKEEIISWGMPDYSAGIASVANTEVTVPCDCLVVFTVTGKTSSLAGAILSYKNLQGNLEPLGSSDAMVANYAMTVTTSGFLSKGEIFKASISAGGTSAVTIYPLKGVR